MQAGVLGDQSTMIMLQVLRENELAERKDPNNMMLIMLWISEPASRLVR